MWVFTVLEAEYVLFFLIDDGIFPQKVMVRFLF